MQIRLATPEDVEAIIDIRHRAFSHSAPSAYNAAQVRTLLADYEVGEFQTMIAQQQLFVAHTDEELCGTAGWHDNNIRHVYVMPECFGKGIGKLLVAHAEEHYRAVTGHDRIDAGVILYARGFYEKCGYQLVKEAKAWDGSDYYFMRKVFPA